MCRSMAIASILAVSPGSFAEVALAPVFTNHMVIQRDQDIIVWGDADPNALVRVTIADRETETRADATGNWSARLPSLPAGGPHELVASSNGDQAEAVNILMGDVWICSGQSNMYWSLSQTDRGQEFIDDPDYPSIRFLQIERTWSNTEKEEAETVGWRMASSTILSRFSAVGFHFGRLLQQEIDVPIGLIQTAWGGTPAEAWTPLDTLQSDPIAFKGILDKLPDYRLSEAEAKVLLDQAREKHEAFVGVAWEEDRGYAATWQDPNLDDSGWGTVDLPGYLDGEIGSLDGIIWLRRRIDLHAESAGKTATLHLGRIDDYDEAFVNGVSVGKTDVDQGDGRRIVRAYDIPEGLLRSGANVVAIRLMDVRSSGGVRPEGRDFGIEVGDSFVPLNGPWKYKIGFDAREGASRFPYPPEYAVPIGRPFRGPAALYNAMIHPLTRLGVKGAIWYQGESNSGRGDEYRQLFPAMIDAWRDRWSEARGERVNLPFYFVQLPNFRIRQDQPAESSWAEIREAQRLTLERAPDTGMAVTIDIGDPADIHPTNKLPVAERLARVALNDVYGIHAEPPASPMPQSVHFHGAQARIDFNHADGLRTVDGASVKGFAVRNESGRWYWAEAEIVGQSVVVQSEGTESISGIRYAWGDNPAVNLVNIAGLPASPFQAFPEE